MSSTVISSRQSPWQARLDTANAERRAAHQWRQRRTLQSQQGPVVEREGKSLINFCSNDYLGLAAKGSDNLSQSSRYWGLGSGASHLVCGHSSAHDELEKALAAHTGYPRALLFSTGYMANLGVINALTERGDLILQDKLNHASLIDGALLSRADFLRYRHLDNRQLQQRLVNRKQSLALVVTDSIFSMDGDIADLASLGQICHQQDALLMVDDAHGFGVIGPHGSGARAAFGLPPERLPVYIGTLGKALGGFGAFVAGSDALIDYLIQFARPYIYTTALPPAVADAMIGNLEQLKQDELRQSLEELIRYFRQRALALGLTLMESDSPIQPLLVGEESRTLELSQALDERGLWVTAIRPPTVPEGGSRLRITLTARHTREQVDRLLNALDELIPANERQPAQASPSSPQSFCGSILNQRPQACAGGQPL